MISACQLKLKLMLKLTLMPMRMHDHALLECHCFSITGSVPAMSSIMLKLNVPCLVQ